MKKNALTTPHEVQTSEIGSIHIFPQDAVPRPGGWPVAPERHPIAWYPARQRLIELVRASADSYVLPPAVVRKAAWRE